MKKIKVILMMILVASIALVTSCSKENAPSSNKDIEDQSPTEVYGASQLIVKMTDAPAVFDSVNIEVLQVAVHYCGQDDDTTGEMMPISEGETADQTALLKDEEECDSTQFSGWMDLETEAGMYNLLDLTNNVTAVLANDTIPAGDITQMRLILGTNNYVVVDSVATDLKTPSGQQSGLKINLNATFEEGHTYEIVLDFDAEESIVVTGNGKYILKPVIKVVSITEVSS